MFIRPDWRDPEPYKKLLEPGLSRLVAWEFLRRNPDYQKDLFNYYDAFPWLIFKDGLGYKYDPESRFGPIELGSDNLGDWITFFRQKWGVGIPRARNWDVFRAEKFTNVYVRRSDAYETIFPEDRAKGPLILMPFDLSHSLESLEAQFAFEVRRLRREGVEQGTVIPRTTRVLAPRVYVEQLRILDAIAANATVQEIGDVLAPSATNNPEERQRDKRIKAAHTAALKMQGTGYLSMI